MSYETLAVALTMRCWADIRLSQSDSGGTLLLIGWSSSRGGLLWSRLCRGSWGATSDSEFSSFSQDMRSWFNPSSPPSGVEANGEVACFEDMILLREEQRAEEKCQKTYSNFQCNNIIPNKESCKCQTGNAGARLSFSTSALTSHIWSWQPFWASAPHLTPKLNRYHSWGDPINGSGLSAGNTACTGVPLNPLFNVNGRAELRLESCLRQARSPRPMADYRTKRVTIPYNTLSLKH